MASGVASPWGLSPPMVARLNNNLDDGNYHLTGELSLTSTPVNFNGTEYISPLTRQNKSYYTFNFGKNNRKKLSNLEKTIRYLNKLKE
jgi:hypothetical protein